MKRIYTSLQILVVLFCTENLFAQQLFKDSGQSLGSYCSVSVQLGDLDGDGDLDASVANPIRINDAIRKTQENEIWLNDGEGNFSKSNQELSNSSDIILFDIDQDGDLDLLENESWAYWIENPIRIWLNDGKANFTRTDRYDFEGAGIVFGKFSGEDNGYQAVTIESSGVMPSDETLLRIYSFDNSSCKLEKSVHFINFGGKGIVPGDLNNDGYTDLVMNRFESDYILLNDKKGGFLKSDQELTDFNHPLQVVLEDFNGDGFLDILLSNRTGIMVNGEYGIRLYLNDGSGRFEASLLPNNLNYQTESVAVADVDNDGDQDIYINHGSYVSESTHLSEILLNDGLANFTSTPALKTLQSIFVSFGDLDNDRDLDIFLACGSFFGSPVGNQVWLNTTIDNDN